ncbi:MAG: sel1 repeat family protein, partial [Verrucomicrobiales bacterium]|nr:sel1 repeat family protein [Verrucomicrobiales bacterium]
MKDTHLLTLIVAAVIGIAATAPAGETTRSSLPGQLQSIISAANAVACGSQSNSALQIAAKNGDAEAQLKLGRMYRDGTDGLEKDLAKACEWWLKAALQGNAAAQGQLGRAYMRGLGVSADSTEAVKWFREGARNGDPWAQLFLGDAYEFGHGPLKKDQQLAVTWWTKSMMKGIPRAQMLVGRAYALGEGVNQNLAESIRLTTLAAKGGDPHAQCALGVAYRDGAGGNSIVDPVEAYRWFALSAGTEGETSVRNLATQARDELAKKLSDG